jgi:hypothetical protein
MSFGRIETSLIEHAALALKKLEFIDNVIFTTVKSRLRAQGAPKKTYPHK